MHKFSKRFLISAGGIAGAAILLGLDLYAGSKDVRTRLEGALQKELGVPVHFGGMHYTLWGGLRGTDARCEFGPMGKDGGAASSLTVPSISASIAWLPLFSGRVVVEKLVIKEPSLTWVQGNDGKWNPPLPKACEPGKKPDGQCPAGSKLKKKHSSGKVEFCIAAIRMENATLRFVDRLGRPSVTFEGANVYLRDPEKPEGTVAVAKTTLREGLTIEKFGAPFSFQKGRIALAPIDARLAQGSIRGSATVSPADDLPAFTLDLLFDGIDLNGLLLQFGEDPAAERTSGTLQGNLDLYGSIGRKKSIEGNGQLRLRNGRMDQMSLLQAIGKVLQIEELRDLELRAAQLDLRAAEGKVFVDSLVMESVNMNLAANGTSEWDGKLDLAARLAVGPKISRQLPGWMEAGFQPVPGGSFREIAFNINGTVSHPSTDLLRVLMGQKYGTQFLNLWQSLSGRGKKKPVDKKKSEPQQEEGDAAPNH